MKITHNKVGQNLNTADASKTDRAGKAGASSKSNDVASLLDAKSSDKATTVDVSERAQDMKRIRELAMAAPDVNEAKVAKFQKMIDEGKYKVDSESVADKMVDDHLAFSE